MIRVCTETDFEKMYRIVNDAARAYDGVIPADRYREPYMPREELKREMESVTFFGFEENGELVGVMGLEPVDDVGLIRHAYVLTAFQKRGFGSRLLDFTKARNGNRRLLVGTWADATWAVDFYRKHGFRLCPNKDELLRKYWDIPGRQIETSVVLELTTRADDESQI